MGWKQAAVNFAAAVLRIRDVTHGAAYTWGTRIFWPQQISVPFYQLARRQAGILEQELAIGFSRPDGT